jgi:hypothetical protein
MSFQKIVEVTINGKKWEIGYGYPGKINGKVNDGLCIWSRNRIVIQRKPKGRERSIVNVLTHELSHAVIPSLDEAYAEILGEVVSEAYEAFQKEAQP